MATNTTNYGLIKPEKSDNYSVDVMGNNMDKIDSAIKTETNVVAQRVGALESKVSNIENVVSGNKITCSCITNGIPVFEQDSFSHTLTSLNAKNVSANIDVPTLYDSIFNITGTISITVTQKLSSSSGSTTLKTYLYDADGNTLFSYSNSSLANGSTITHEMNIPLNKKLHLNVQFKPFNSNSNVVTTIAAYSVSI